MEPDILCLIPTNLPYYQKGIAHSFLSKVHLSAETGTLSNEFSAFGLHGISRT